LDGGAHGEILLPGRYLPNGAKPGEDLDVFVYRDSEDRLVATTEHPLAMVGEFALLRVVSQSPGIGAFLDWGLEKDLLLPRREFAGSVRVGKSILVYVTVDARSDRLIATARLNRHLNLAPPKYSAGEPVKLIIESDTPLGYRAIINHAHTGLLYRSEIAGPRSIGQTMDGFIRTLRADGKIDLGLDPAGHQRIEPLSEKILAALKAAGGSLPCHDGSPPELIRSTLGMSKKAFKQAAGTLYRKRQILLESDGIRLPESH
jgi:predicted RNA-binding protein (virulence factor B family)